MKSELVDIDAKCRWNTDNAYLLDVGKENPVWFPKQYVEDNGDGTFTMPRWLAENKGVV